MFEMRVAKAFLCATLVPALAFHPVLSASAAGTNTTLPSQCAANDHPAGCWGNVKFKEIARGFFGFSALTKCPNQSTAESIDRGLKAMGEKISARKYRHFFMIPQGEAAYLSAGNAWEGDHYTACSQSVAGALHWQMLGLAAAEFASAALWARIAGSPEYFQQYSDRLFKLFNDLTTQTVVDESAREYAFEIKHVYCVTQNPDDGPDYPDYGRLLTWDDFHRLQCDNFNYY